VSNDNIIKLDSARKRRRSTHRNLAQWGACSTGPVRSRPSRGLSRQACRFEDRGRPPARRAPRSPAGARGDDRYRSGRRAPTRVCVIARRPPPIPTASGSRRRSCRPTCAGQSRSRRCCRSLYLKGISTAISPSAGCAARQGCCRVVGIRHRPPEGWLARRAHRVQKRDLSAKR